MGIGRSKLPFLASYHSLSHDSTLFFLRQYSNIFCLSCVTAFTVCFRITIGAILLSMCVCLCFCYTFIFIKRSIKPITSRSSTVCCAWFTPKRFKRVLIFCCIQTYYFIVKTLAWWKMGVKMCDMIWFIHPSERCARRVRVARRGAANYDDLQCVKHSNRLVLLSVLFVNNIQHFDGIFSTYFAYEMCKQKSFSNHESQNVSKSYVHFALLHV